MKRHRRRPPNGEPTATFNELSFSEQAKSITATTNVLGRMIDSNVRRASQEGRDPNDTREKRCRQVHRMMAKKEIESHSGPERQR